MYQRSTLSFSIKQVHIATLLKDCHGNLSISLNTKQQNTKLQITTGTLTVGTPSVAGITLAEDASVDLLGMLRIAASVERFSSHILAKGIVDYASANHIALLSPESVTELRQVEGNGVEAKVIKCFILFS